MTIEGTDLVKAPSLDYAAGSNARVESPENRPQTAEDLTEENAAFARFAHWRFQPSEKNDNASSSMALCAPPNSVPKNLWFTMPEGEVDLRLLTENINRMVIRDNGRCLFSPLLPTDARWANADAIDQRDFLRMDVAVIKTICAVGASLESSRTLPANEDALESLKSASVNSSSDAVLDRNETEKANSKTKADEPEQEQASIPMHESSDGEEVTSEESSGEETGLVSPNPGTPAEVSPTEQKKENKLSPAATPFVPAETALLPAASAHQPNPHQYAYPPTYNGFGYKAMRRTSLTIKRTISVATNFVRVLPLLKNLFVYNVSVSPPCPAATRRALFQRLMQQAQRLLKRDHNGHAIYPVYSGEATVVTAHALHSALLDKVHSVKWDVSRLREESEDFPATIFQISIEKHAEFDSADVSEAVTGDLRTNARGKELVKGIDMVLRSRSLAASGLSTRTHFFDVPMPMVDSALRQVIHGHVQELKVADGQLLLNVDVASYSFFISEAVSAYAGRLFGLALDASAHLSDRMLFYLGFQLRGVRVETHHLPGPKGNPRARRYTVFGAVRESAASRMIDFRHAKGVDCISVESFFWRKYAIRLKYPRLPLLQMGKDEQSTTFLPMELCTIVAGQRCTRNFNDVETSNLISESSVTPVHRLSIIDAIMTDKNFVSDANARHFNVAVDDQMYSVQAKVLAPPTIQYGNKYLSLDERAGVWDTRDACVVRPSSRNVTWVVVVLSRTISFDHASKFAFRILHETKRIGMFLSEPTAILMMNENNEELMLTALFPTILASNPNHVLFILDGNTAVYNSIKFLGDCVFAVPTQCVRAQNVHTCHSSLMLANVGLKINARLGGINSVVLKKRLAPHLPNLPILENYTLVLGAKILCPTAKLTTMGFPAPFIASVVSSTDDFPCSFFAQSAIVNPNKRTIEHLAEAVYNAVKVYRSRMRAFPLNVVYYRSLDAREETPLADEMNALLQGLTRHSITPKTTFVTAQSHHFTRLFARSERGVSNVPPGTLIDGGIVNGARGEFILNAHRGTKGTNRCMLYCVRWVKTASTWKDAGDAAVEHNAVKELTWNLCHASAASTRAVSVPSPVHYADLAAERALAHFECVEDTGFGKDPAIGRDEEGNPVSFGTSDFNLDARRDISTCGMIFI